MTYGQLAAAVNEAMRPAAAPAQARSLELLTERHIVWAETGTGPQHAMSLPALYSVVRLIASTVDQLNLTTSSGALPSQIADPRAWGSSLDLGDQVQHCVTSMALTGAGYSLATPMLDSDKTLRWRIDALHPSSVQALVSTGGVVRVDYVLDGRPIPHVPATYAGRSAVIDSLRDRAPGTEGTPHILASPYLITPDHPEGSTPVRDAWQSVAGYLAVERQAANLLDGGTYSGGRLETDHDLTVEQAKRYREQWVINRKNGQIPVLGGGIRYASDAIDPVKAQFLETRLANAQAIGSLFGVPPSMLGYTMAGGTSSLSYTNALDARVSYRQSCLEGFTRQISDSWSTLLPPGQRFEFDYSDWEASADANTDPAA